MKFLAELMLFPFQVVIFLIVWTLILISLIMTIFWWSIGLPIAVKKDGKVVGKLRWFTVYKE
jgi:hypothetical protein